MLYLYILFSLLLVTLQGTQGAEKKRVEEVEDEIGYIQSLVLNTPAIASVKSSYQDIEVYESSHFGKVFLLDECLQLTERDAPHYNEMLAHVPMMEYMASYATNPEPMRVLVLGGGDGYVVSELLKYPLIESIDHVELDVEVINISKKHFKWASAWEHEKVNLVIGDGAAFVEKQAKEGNSYHVIIQDASDPFYTDSDGSVVTLPSHVLYKDAHFKMMHTLLQPKKGVLMFQAETYNIPSNLEEIRKWRHSLEKIGFENVRYGSISISTYPTGQIGFFASHVHDDGEEMVCKSNTCKDNSFADDNMNTLDWIDWNRILTNFKELSGETKYYHPRIHRR